MTITAANVKWTARGIPADCTPAKLNLAGAYRTIYKNIEVGDVVRVRQADGRLVASGTRATKDSFWVQVVKVERGSRGWVTIHCAGNRTLPSAAAQTAITRKERKAEYDSRLARNLAARRAALEANVPAEVVAVTPIDATPAAACTIENECDECRSGKICSDRCATCNGSSTYRRCAHDTDIPAEVVTTDAEPVAMGGFAVGDRVTITTNGRTGTVDKPSEHTAAVRVKLDTPVRDRQYGWAFPANLEIITATKVAAGYAAS